MEFLRFFWWTVLFYSTTCSANDLFGSKFPNDIPEYDLLRAIGVPFSNPKTQYFDEGLDGFPAYGLKPGSDIKSPYRLFMPEKLYAEYSITATVRPANKDGGFLFSVVNPLETVVQLGVQLIPSGPGLTNISLLYTDANVYALSQTIASFVVPSFAKKWSRFALRVTTDNVTLFLNCHEFDTVTVKRNPLELVFDSASTLYVGQAGPLIRGAFHVKVSVKFPHIQIFMRQELNTDPPRLFESARSSDSLRRVIRAPLYTLRDIYIEKLMIRPSIALQMDVLFNNKNS